MEIGLREWLIVVGIIVIGGILFDGWRRIRGGKSKLKLKLDRSLANVPDVEEDNELLRPARVSAGHEQESLDEEDLPSLSAEPDGRQPAREALDELAPTLDSAPAEVQKRKSQATTEGRDSSSMDGVLVINVVARDVAGFKGPALLQSILESGLRFGEMDIFHRHESMAGNGEVWFSMANGVKPGTFDLDDIDHFTTRAVSFFLSLPGPRHPKQAFDIMVAAARKLAQELDGELKDDQRSVMTAQTIEHYRQRIVDFERRLLTHKR